MAKRVTTPFAPQQIGITMTKQEWIEYFEAVHSRSPIESEILAAAQAGEFATDSEPQLSAPEEPRSHDYAHPTPQSRPAENPVHMPLTGHQVSSPQGATEQISPNQGVNPPASASSDSTTTQPEASASNRLSWKSYFLWLKQSLIAPSQNSQVSNTYFPWLTIGMISVAAALSLTLYLWSMFAKIQQSSLGSLGSLMGIRVSNPVNIGTFFALLIGCISMLITVAFSTWVGLKVLKEQSTFADVLNRYAGLFVPITAMLLLAGLFSLIQLAVVGLFFIVIASLTVQLSTSYIIFTAANNLSIDNFYAKLLAIFISQIILGIITVMLFTILGATVLGSVIGAFMP
ncbi:DUF6574 domain-containing protein [Bifidobacterium aquikefiri]|uniref:DUF6574 domain-containing protein n=2 Tax=Bifidobacterium aquikefiri TaxID=1653207 RepID=UPI0039EB626B